MAPWWLYGGYVFPVVVKLENLTYWIKFDLEGWGQLPPKTIGILTNVFCTSGPNLVILAWMVDELWGGQAQNGITFDFDLKFDLESQGWLPLKTKGTLTKVFCIFGPNLVILAWTSVRVIARTNLNECWVIARTNLVTDGRTGATTIPGGQNWPWVKTISSTSTQGGYQYLFSACLVWGVKRTFILWFTDIGKSFTDIGRWITYISENDLPISVNQAIYRYR